MTALEETANDTHAENVKQKKGGGQTKQRHGSEDLPLRRQRQELETAASAASETTAGKTSAS